MRRSSERKALRSPQAPPRRSSGEEDVKWGLGCSAAPVDERPQRPLSYKVTIVQGSFPQASYDDLCRTVESMFTRGTQRFCRYNERQITIHGYKIFYIRREVSARCIELMGDFTLERVRTDLVLTMPGPAVPQKPHKGSMRPRRHFWGPSKQAPKPEISSVAPAPWRPVSPTLEAQRRWVPSLRTASAWSRPEADPLPRATPKPSATSAQRKAAPSTSVPNPPWRRNLAGPSSSSVGTSTSTTATGLPAPARDGLLKNLMGRSRTPPRPSTSSLVGMSADSKVVFHFHL